MSTTTAVILIGQAHQNDSGINPTHIIQFTENSRPALILKELDGRNNNKVIIPTLENTIDDIYLIIAVYILKLVNPPKQLDNFQKDSLYDILNNEERKKLYEETIMTFKNIRLKVVFNILDESHLLNHLEQIKKYPNDFEVTLPAFKKEYNAWSKQVITKGL
jgi:hypothetical protein